MHVWMCAAYLHHVHSERSTSVQLQVEERPETFGCQTDICRLQNVSHFVCLWRQPAENGTTKVPSGFLLHSFGFSVSVMTLWCIKFWLENSGSNKTMKYFTSVKHCQVVCRNSSSVSTYLYIYIIFDQIHDLINDLLTFFCARLLCFLLPSQQKPKQQ